MKNSSCFLCSALSTFLSRSPRFSCTAIFFPNIPSLSVEMAPSTGSSGADKKLIPALTQDAFLALWMAMATEVLVKAGEMTQEALDEEVEKLPPEARTGFKEKRRCSFSFMTDRTSLALFASKPFSSGGQLMLRACFLTQLFLHGPDLSGCLDDVFLHSYDDVKRALGETLGDLKKSPVTAQMQTGLLSMFRQYWSFYGHEPNTALGVSVIESIARVVWHFDAHLSRLWTRLLQGADLFKELVRPLAAGGFGVADFKAQLVCRMTFVGSCGRFGADSATSCVVGPGAAAAIHTMTGSGFEQRDLAVALSQKVPEWTVQLQARDSNGVGRRLAELGLAPYSAQTYQHLCCEARKIFCPGQRAAYHRRPGYQKLFWRAMRGLQKIRQGSEERAVKRYKCG